MIHNSSVIDKKARVANSVKIGPFCYIGPGVDLSDNVELISNPNEIVLKVESTKVSKAAAGNEAGQVDSEAS